MAGLVLFLIASLWRLNLIGAGRVLKLVASWLHAGDKVSFTPDCHLSLSFVSCITLLTGPNETI